MNENTIITITRQYGSGGKEIANIIAEKMGVKCYDRKVVTKAAENINNGDSFDQLISNAYDTPDDFFSTIASLASQGTPIQNQMYREQAKIILQIAQKGSAVFLGRCADYILRNQPNTYSFFIYANDDFRINRAKTRYNNCSLKDLEKVDKQRKRYYAYYTGQVWGDYQNYDMMINSSELPLDIVADMIIGYVNIRQDKDL